MKTLLHVGCGRQSKETLPPLDFETQWKEIRIDLDPDVEPDIVDDIRTLSKVADGTGQMLFSKHNIEHLDYHEVPLCFSNFHRVLDDTGFAIVRTPDLVAICRAILEHGPETKLYEADTLEGPREVTGLDMLFGASWELARGNDFMAHRTAFSGRTLTEKLRAAGFEHVEVSSEAGELRGFAVKKTEGNLYWQLSGRKPVAT
ncbi:MAG: SAM-dependent methyltransferase [Nisaea sp.]|uniref:class I SAM-dependent methyltransferase n=1 Tax=Nisaea sp. TaxID=2024842 RepID=UPI001B288DF0|nr:SAM-dependent methyltransferase [Nisaea sp.]MBO6561533.1 SAM-dependent methyltransferase [Nisaea sp.]